MDPRNNRLILSREHWFFHPEEGERKRNLSPIEQQLNSGGLVKVLLLSPNSYQIMTPNLGVSFLYRTLHSYEDIKVERAFLNYPGSRTSPVTLSLESRLDFLSFDLICISFSFEPDTLNLLNLLNQAGIPLKRDDRDERHPFILAGGKGITNNPWPLNEFIDLAIIGDGEDSIITFLKFFKENHRVAPREDLAKYFFGKQGYFVAGLQQRDSKITPALYSGFSRNPAHSVVTSPLIEFPDRFLIEVGRGCPYRCAFCLHGTPECKFLWADKDLLLEKIIRHTREQNRPTGLVGSAVLSHPHIHEIINTLREESISFSISSLRAEKITREFLLLWKESGQQTLTLAPETASDSFRQKVGKTTKNVVFRRAVTEARKLKIRKFKFYFMLGLPGEQDEDALRIIDFLHEVFPENEKGVEITLSIGIFVPKPGTLFGNELLIEESVLRKRIQKLRKTRHHLSRVKLQFESYKMAQIQFLFAAGGPLFSERLAELTNWNISPANFRKTMQNYYENSFNDDRIFY